MDPVPRIPVMRLEPANLHTDGEICHEREILLRIVGDFTLWVRDEQICKEAGFCLVELAVELAAWVNATDMGLDFLYTSTQSEAARLVRFTNCSPGNWRISAGRQMAAGSVTTDELKAAALAYIRELYALLQPDLDLLKWIEDPEESAVLRQALAP